MAIRKSSSKTSRDGGVPGVFFEVAEGILILRFRSRRFTLAEAQEIQSILYERLENIANRVVLNLEGVDYIDSSAISLLVRMSNDKGLRIVNVSASVENTLKAINIFELLYILDSEIEARRSFFEV